MTCGQVWLPILGISALHLSHPKCTHTAVNTHTPWTHTRSSGQPMLRRPGSSLGFGALLKGLTSVVVLRVERERCTFTPPTYNPCWTWDSNPQPLGYKSDSLSIRPRLPEVKSIVNVFVILIGLDFNIITSDFFSESLIELQVIVVYNILFVVFWQFRQCWGWCTRCASAFPRKSTQGWTLPSLPSINFPPSLAPSLHPSFMNERSIKTLSSRDHTSAFPHICLFRDLDFLFVCSSSRNSWYDI